MRKKYYKVASIQQGTLHISGHGNSLQWKKASVLSNFHTSWDYGRQNPLTFKALWDGMFLYFRIAVKNTRAYLDSPINHPQDIGMLDRVELFFRSNPTSLYYCIEINAKIAMTNFKTITSPYKKFDFDWSWPENEVLIKSMVTDYGYTVEGRVSIKSLKELHLIQNETLQVGIYRIHYIQKDYFDYWPIGTTWVQPESKTSDFHLPSSFGVFLLDKNGI
ncbi:sugar-binding protein [Ulvibacterium sp.]|uniref:sugar-binding protein n=1 Tax=Ulvibacterium sp. TaxID=2665914 RepID=UPI003BAA6690